MEDFTQKTLGELLSSSNEAIRRNAIGILKQLQRTQSPVEYKKKTEWVNEPKHKSKWQNEEKH